MNIGSALIGTLLPALIMSACGTSDSGSWGQPTLIAVAEGCGNLFDGGHGFPAGVVSGPAPAQPWPRVAVDDIGHAVVVWRQCRDLQSDKGNEIWSAYFDGKGWSSSARIGVDAITHAYPKVVLAPSGLGVAVWADAPPNATYALFDPIAGWSPATGFRLNGNADPKLVGDKQGGATVTAGSSDGDLWATHFTRGGGWSEPRSLASGASFSAISPFGGPPMGADAQGNATVVWAGPSSPFSVSIWAAHFDVATGWSARAQIEGAGGHPDVAENAFGDAIVAWANNTKVTTRRFRAGQGWESPIRVDAMPPVRLEGQEASMAIDAQGNALVAWNEELQVFTNRVSVDGAVGTPQPFSRGGGAVVHMDSAGNGFVVWNELIVNPGQETRGSNVLKAARYVPGRGWGQAQTIRTRPDCANGQTPSPGSSCVAPTPVELAADASGNFFVLWYEQDGVDDRQQIWIARYSAH